MMEVIVFENADVITSSGDNADDYTGQELPVGG